MTRAGAAHPQALLRGTRLALGLMAVLLGACATFKAPGGLPPATPQTAASSPTGDAVPTSIALKLEAPDALTALLQNNLDLSRLARTPSSDALSDFELRRIEASTPSQVRALLETEGYFSSTVTMRRDTEREVVVHVDPGPRTTVQQLRFEFQGDLERQATLGDVEARSTVATLRALWPMGLGAAFRNARWTDGKSALLAKLRAEGYAAASWAGTAADIDATAHAAHLTLVLDSGPRYRMGNLRIEGLALHDPATVQNLTGFKAGSPATEAVLLDYQERLIRTGLYDRVSVTLDTDQADSAGTPVIVRLQEAPLQQATTGVGISANTGPRVSLEHTHRRVFGERATLRNKFELGRLRQAWEGELSSHAQPDLYRNLVGGAFERLVASDDSDVVRSARVRLGRTRETTTQERYTFVQLERTDRRTATTLNGITGLSLNHHGVWRRVDSVVLPTQGQSLSLQTGLGVARGDEGQGPYGRLQARINLWQPLGGQWFGHARFEAGQVFVRNNLAVPQTQLFRVGGDDSVRGYAYRSLGPTVDGSVGGGRVMTTASLEVARPVSDALPTVWWALFADAGQAANRWRDATPVWGAGVGVRWRSPVGPLSVDWAWGEATRRSRLHLSVGIAF